MIEKWFIALALIAAFKNYYSRLQVWPNAIQTWQRNHAHSSERYRECTGCYRDLSASP